MNRPFSSQVAASGLPTEACPNSRPFVASPPLGSSTQEMRKRGFPHIVPTTEGSKGSPTRGFHESLLARRPVLPQAAAPATGTNHGPQVSALAMHRLAYLSPLHVFIHIGTLNNI